MFRSSFPLLRKSEPPVQVQDTIITAWTIRHPTRNRNDPIARAELYQLSYIPPEPSWSMHEGVKSVFYSFPWRSWAILDLNQRPRP
nr:unknown [Medicago truncatula]